MKLSSKPGLRLLGTLAAVAVGWLGWTSWVRWKQKWESSRFVSCMAHRNHLWFDLRIDHHYLKNPRYLPYLPEVEGAMLWAAYGRPVGSHNCHHGAPGRNFGGWQGMNFSEEKWREVLRRWSLAHGSLGAPLFWCGGPDPSQRRVFTTAVNGFGDELRIDKEVLPEAECARRVVALNEILTAMGERAVSLNVPDKVDWDKAPPWSTPEWRKPPTTRTNSTPPLPSASFRP